MEGNYFDMIDGSYIKLPTNTILIMTYCILFSLKQSETTPFASSRLDYPLMEKKRVIGTLKMIIE